MTNDFHFKVTAFNRASLASLAIIFGSVFALAALMLDGQPRLITFALAATILAFVLGHMASASVTLAPDALRIGAGLFRKRIAYTDIIGTSRDPSQLKVGWRMGGIGLPGFGLGWFSGGGGKRLFVAAGRKHETMRLKLRRDFDVIVGVADPDALSRALAPHGKQTM
jgi:hypothetical protein